ncbi:MAG TPA: PIN domain-containing protein [Dehalococcoidia bacterium]|nr:PIN domain-containing protein [Dehalococcoidia bacterium]
MPRRSLKSKPTSRQRSPRFAETGTLPGARPARESGARYEQRCQRRSEAGESARRRAARGTPRRLCPDHLSRSHGELASVLARPRIIRRLGWTPQALAAFIGGYRAVAIEVVPTTHISGVLPDPADHALLEAAITGRADYIVTGDTAVLALGRYADVAIVRPARFLAILSGGLHPGSDA